MITAMPSAKTCAEAWLRAATHLVDNGDEAYNLVVDIDDARTHTQHDRLIIKGVDDFLRLKRANPISTVINTIFPQHLYLQHGDGAFVKEYLRGYNSLKNKGWGRYFQRMVRWPAEGGGTTDQLHELVRRLAQQHSAARTFRNVFELTRYDPARDRNRNRNRQCLSFLSFKLHPQRGLTLTAMYRNHDYIARALGNFIALGHLMAYIAKRVGTNVGPLTCVSTHAEIDTASAQPDPDGSGEACLGWRLTEARHLVRSMQALAPSKRTKPKGVAQ